MLTFCAYGVSDQTTTKKTKSERNYLKIFFTPGLECEDNIIARINKSKKMDIAVYSITNLKITDALLKAYERGAEIRIVTDRTQSKGKNSTVGKLKEAGIPLLTNIKHRIEHNKFAVFDDIHVVSGSYNWTTNATKYNSENCVFFKQKKNEYSTRFEELWELYGTNPESLESSESESGV